MFRTVTSFVAWTRNLDIGRRLDGKPLTEETQGAGSRRGECVCIRISCESTTTDSQRERAEAQFGGGSSCGSMFTSRTDRGRSHSPMRGRQAQPWLAKALNPASLLPGMVIGFLLGLWVELPKGGFRGSSSVPAKKGSVGGRNVSASSDEGGELKMVFVVRQDLKMGSGKIASQCAHAATGIYNELLSRNRALLKRWEDCGQPKIVVTCKNQKEMNELRGRADSAGLPTYTVADAGRTQVAAGSKTVLVIGPGSKASVDSVTRHLRLL